MSTQEVIEHVVIPKSVLWKAGFLAAVIAGGLVVQNAVTIYRISNLEIWAAGHDKVPAHDGAVDRLARLEATLSTLTRNTTSLKNSGIRQTYTLEEIRDLLKKDKQ